MSRQKSYKLLLLWHQNNQGTNEKVRDKNNLKTIILLARWAMNKIEIEDKIKEDFVCNLKIDVQFEIVIR